MTLCTCHPPACTLGHAAVTAVTVVRKHESESLMMGRGQELGPAAAWGVHAQVAAGAHAPLSGHGRCGEFLLVHAPSLSDAAGSFHIVPLHVTSFLPLGCQLHMQGVEPGEYCPATGLIHNCTAWGA
jgi:hypothetical protein